MRNIKKKIRQLKKHYHPLLKNVPFELRPESWLRFAVSKEHGFICFRIPKAANSTIIRTLAQHAFPGKTDLTADSTGEKAKKYFGNLGDLKYYNKKSVLKHFFVFSFFRNPYSRVLSAYLDKLQTDEYCVYYQWVADEMGFNTTKDMSFSDFIGYLEQGNVFKNGHWAPQTSLCPFSVDELNFTGKIERLKIDLPFVVDRIFGNNTYQGMATREQSRQHAGTKIKQYYTDNLMQRVQALYLNDIQSLDYEFPG